MKGKWPGHGGPKGATPISQVLACALPHMRMSQAAVTLRQSFNQWENYTLLLEYCACVLLEPMLMRNPVKEVRVILVFCVSQKTKEHSLDSFSYRALS